MTITPFPRTIDEARAFDAADPLAAAREAFALPEGVTYLVGHSLGPPPRCALEAAAQVTHVGWKQGLVGSWNAESWIDLPLTVGRKLAGLIGADDGDVVVCDSVSINLYKLVAALLGTGRYGRRVIVEAGEFPTDQYILERLSAHIDCEFVRASQGGGADALAAGGGIFVRSLVDYRSGEVADVAAMEQQARDCGGAIVWDLSHATGVINLNLRDDGARYAVGCTYKYLNGGPGAPGFMYVHGAHVDELETPLAGWLGHKRPFAFDNNYEAADGVQRFVAGTPPIISLATLNGALDIFEGVSLADIEAKTNRMGDMCLVVFETLELASLSPAIGQRRGGHVSLIHSHGYEVSRALAARGHQSDFRTPDTIRLGLSPLFLSYCDVWGTLEALRDVLARKSYLAPEYAVRSKVT